MKCKSLQELLLYRVLRDVNSLIIQHTNSDLTPYGYIPMIHAYSVSYVREDMRKNILTELYEGNQ